MAAAIPKSPASNDERIHDAAEWVVEAKAVIKDVEDCVASFSISKVLPASDESVYLNLTTLEQDLYTLELSAAGFRVMSRVHDSVSEPSEKYYETPYSLLDSLSPLYRAHFCSALSAKLEALQHQQQ